MNVAGRTLSSGSLINNCFDVVSKFIINIVSSKTYFQKRPVFTYEKYENS